MKIVATTVNAFSFATPSGRIMLTETGSFEGVSKLIDNKNRSLLVYRESGMASTMNEVVNHKAILHVIAGTPSLIADLGIEDAKNVAEVTQPPSV